MSIPRAPLRLPIPFLAVAVLVSCGPQDLVEEATSEIRGCAPTHPDYPDCGTVPPPDPDGDPAECLEHVQGHIYVTSSSLTLGQRTTLGWSVVMPSSCAALGQVTINSRPVALEGTRIESPLASFTYHLRIGTTLLASASVTVALPQTVRIHQDSEWHKRLLIQAVKTPGTLVLLVDGLEMDLTHFSDISFARGVTLRSEYPITFEPMLQKEAAFSGSPSTNALISWNPSPGPVVRNPHRLGPRIYTNSRPRPLFVVACDNDDPAHLGQGHNVRISGFRLQGPHWDTVEGDDNLERGITVHSCRGVEISNMEVFGWAGAGVRVQDGVNLLDRDNMVKVKDSFFHHNQHASGHGYGVDVAVGAYADIQGNVFDFNRHAIAASGEAGTGYRAERNLVLKGGGVHGRWYNEYTHQFDVHGDAHCPNVPYYDDATYNCGNAGERFWMSRNAFQYTSDNAVKVRGTPRELAEITDNVFAHSDIGDAVVPFVAPRVVSFPNRTGVDPFGKYGVCDFDGDGQDDLFLATGVTWWYASAGRMHWSFLNSANEQLHEVGLGDFDGDGKCDVFTVHGATGEISSGGRASWTPVPGSFPMPFNELRFGNFVADARTDIFWRRPDTEWHVISPGIQDWTAIQSDPMPLEGLRFGDFDGNGVTDVLSSWQGRWRVSWDARQDWAWLNVSLTGDLLSLLIGNVDGLPGDDILRWVAEGPIRGHWDVSSGGGVPFKSLGTVEWEDKGIETDLLRPAEHVKGFVGRFDRWAGADLLTLDHWTRTSRIFSQGHEAFTPYSLFPH